MSGTAASLAPPGADALNSPEPFSAPGFPEASEPQPAAALSARGRRAAVGHRPWAGQDWTGLWLRHVLNPPAPVPGPLMAAEMQAQARPPFIISIGVQATGWGYVLHTMAFQRPGPQATLAASGGEGTKDSTCHHPLRHLWGWVSEGPRPTNQRTGTEKLAPLPSGSAKLQARPRPTVQSARSLLDQGAP